MNKQGRSKKAVFELFSEKTTSESICSSQERGRVKASPTQKPRRAHKHFSTENFGNGGT